MAGAKRLFIVGILVMALPHLGFIGMIENIIYFVFGLLILVSAYGIYLEKKKISTVAVQNEEVKIYPVAQTKKPVARIRTQRKIPSPYLPPVAAVEAPNDNNGFVFIKKKEDKAHSL